MIEYRRLTHDDYNDIVDISKYIWDGYDYLPSLFHKWVDDEGYFLGAVDTEKNKVVGVGKFSILYDKSGWLEGLRVHKDYRGQKIARQISERVLDIAKGYLEEGRIKRIAFSTHVSNTESITLMKKLDFKLEAEYIIVCKPREDVVKTLKPEDFAVEQWAPSFEEFMNLPYLKRRNNILPIAFYFHEPTIELYEELKSNGGFVSINGYKGIFIYKQEPDFACMEDTFDAIDTYMNYYLLKYNKPNMAWPITTIMPGDKHLIEHLKEEGYEPWAEWRPDYLWYVYKE
jgi:RimJ/RimL family protein N-acetyltransferase